MSFDATNNCQPCACVATCQLDYSLAWREFALRFGIFNDLTGNAIFLGKAGVEIIEFSQNPAIQPFG